MTTALSSKDAAAVKKAATAGGLSSSAGTSIVSAANAGKVINTNTGVTQNYSDYVSSLPKTQAYTPPATITANGIANQGTVNLPTPPPGPDYAGAAASAATTKDALSVHDTTNAASDPNQFSLKNITELLQDNQGTVPNTAAIYADQERQAGIAQKQQLVNDYTAQLNSITAKAEAQKLQVTGQGRGIPEVIIGGQQAQITKEAAIESLPVAAQLAAAQGNLATAQQHVDTYAKLLISDAQAKYQHQQDLIKTILPFVTAAENRRLQVLDQQHTEAYNTQKDTINYAQSLATAAIANGQGAIAGSILKLLQNPSSPTLQQDIAAYAGQITPKPKAAGTGTGSTTTSDGYRFTSTQVNSGAAKAGIPLEEFKTLSSDTQNYFVNKSPTELKEITDLFAGVQAGTTDRQEVKDLINASPTTQAVKDFWNKKLDGIVSPETGGSFLGDIWSSVKSFFNF